MVKKAKQSVLWYVLAILAILMLLSLIIYIVLFSNQNNISSNTTQVNIGNLTTLTIDSNPVGVTMVSKGTCGSEIIHTTTPYNCRISIGSEVVINAPAQFINNKSYTFRTWEGCSESNTDKSICKIKIVTSVQRVKATYDAINNQAKSPSSQPITKSPNCNGELGTTNGSQQCQFTINFIAARIPGRLTVYAVQTNPLLQLYQEITFTADCSVHEACINETTSQPISGKVVSSRIDFDITKPTSIVVQTPLEGSYGNPVNRFILNQWVYYPDNNGTGGAGVYYDALRSEYTKL